MEGKVQSVGPSMRDGCLTPPEGMVRPSDAATDTIADPCLKCDASQALCIVEGLLAEWNVPEIVADALTL